MLNAHCCSPGRDTNEVDGHHLVCAPLAESCCFCQAGGHTLIDMESWPAAFQTQAVHKAETCYRNARGYYQGQLITRQWEGGPQHHSSFKKCLHLVSHLVGLRGIAYVGLEPWMSLV